MKHVVPNLNRPKNPYDEASWFSRLVFIWPSKLLATGYNRTLQEEDLPEVSVKDESSKLVQTLESNWKKEKKVDNALLRSVLRSHGGQFWWGGLLLLAESPFRIYQANLLGYLVSYLFGATPSEISLYNNGYFLSGMLCLCSLIVMVVHHHYFFNGFRWGMQIRIALTGLIYNKAVALNMKSLSQIATGKIVSLSSQDVEVFVMSGLWSHFTYQPIIEALAILYFGIQEVGVSFVAGFAGILLLVPLQSFFSGIIAKNRKITGGYTDERIKLVNQALMGVRIMKMNGWEWAFRELVQSVRKKEVGSLIKTNRLKAFNEAIFFCAPSIVACLVWLTYVLRGGTLTVKKMFTILQYLVIVQFSVTKFFTLAVQYVSEGVASLRRIESLLLLDEAPAESLAKSEVSALQLEAGEEEEASAGAASAVVAEAAPSGGAVELVGAKTKADTSASASNGAGATTDESQFAVEFDHVYATWEAESAGAPAPQAIANSAATEEDSSASRYAIRDMTFKIRHNELIVVIGSVGSSKSSLLMTLLGELTPSQGSVSVHNMRPDSAQYTSYCAQEPWIMSGTIQQNILFGRPMDRKWYDEVTTACALKSDFSILTHGDSTIIGDRGINLSGGQRARVGLARAVYGRSSLNLLDDPLSAVDPNVGAHLFEDVICGVLGNSTRVLVTHQTQYLSSPQVSRVLIVDNGRIIALDTYKTLQKSGELSVWLDIVEKTQKRDRGSSAASVESAGSAHSDSVAGRIRSNSSVSEGVSAADASEADAFVAGKGASHSSAESSVATGAGALKEDDANVTEGITVKEDRETGNVSWDTYATFATYVGSGPVLFGLLILMLWGQVMAVLVNIWLARWSKLENHEQKQPYNLNIYLTLVAVFMAASIIRCVTCYTRITKASIKMHDAMLTAVLRAPILFFDSNPVGRVLNRFSKDISVNDNMMPEIMFDFSQLVLMVSSTVLIVALGNYFIFIVLIPLVIGFHYLREYYMRTTREAKRLEAIARSPIFSHLSETLDGLVTIRSYKHMKTFIDINYANVNRNTSAFFAFLSGARWLGFRLDLLSVAFTVMCTFSAVLAKEFGAPVSPTILAVGILYVIQLTGLFQWAVRQSAEVENLMVSVERIVSYSRLSPEHALLSSEMRAQVDSKKALGDAAAASGKPTSPEDVESAGVVALAAKRKPIVTPPKEWPQHGKVVAQNLVCTYRLGLPPVIRDISFTIQPGQRVGVVGRTGAGKSSLMSTLLRLIDITSGSLLIDDIDVESVGLHELRPRISVIPQVPFLFMGSVRQNLDMFHDHSDAAIWQAVDALNLRAVITQKAKDVPAGGLDAPSPAKSAPASPVRSAMAPSSPSPTGPDEVTVEVDSNPLEAEVSENGGNFSVGERQLLCLCRAMLQKNKILIMDEATANVDMDTDREIQRAIRKEFTSSTVIMIAHRLQTVIDCDAIIVLSQGELVEMGHPYELLRSGAASGEDTSNSFYSMVNDTGPMMAKQLHDLAKVSYEQREGSQ